MCGEIICTVSLSLAGKESKVSFKNDMKCLYKFFRSGFLAQGPPSRRLSTGVLRPLPPPLVGFGVSRPLVPEGILSGFSCGKKAEWKRLTFKERHLPWERVVP